MFCLLSSSGSADLCRAHLCSEKDSGPFACHHRQSGLRHCQVSNESIDWQISGSLKE